jgi:beta-glucosidase
MYPFQDITLSIDERVNNLLSLLTRDEKIQLLNNSGQEIQRLGFKTAGQVEGYHGAALGGPGEWGKGVEVTTTQFCQAYGLGETWDPEMLKQVATVEGTEFRYVYHRFGRAGLVVRAPNADLGRDPRWGRTEECYGEDPYLNGTMTAAFVQGLQGDDPKYLRTAALLKHFLANSNEDDRDASSSNFDERNFREYYSVPFRMGFETGSDCFMAAYNAYNHIPCTVHPMLKHIAIHEWGVDGIICTDGGGLGLLVSAHHYYPNNAEATAACIHAGISQFLDKLHSEGVNAALDSNLLTMADIDRVLQRNLKMMMRLGIFDPPERVPYTKVGTMEPWTTDAHKSLARLVTRKSIVLLKNSNQLLPLNINNLKSIAVIGPIADKVFLDWYSGTPPYTVTPLAGIRAKAGTEVTVNYAVDNNDNAAINIARPADVAIVFVGNDPLCGAEWAESQYPSQGKEAIDRRSITLEPQDENLIQEVHAANPNTIVVLVSSYPYAINWTQQNIPAILHMTHNSQEMGNALADVLFGDYNPGGRLVQTWPSSLDQIPEMMDYNIRNGRTYMYFHGAPLYYFGYGLSYTTFAYSNLRTSAGLIKGTSDTITVSVDVTNTGARDGEEVVQMYVKHLGSVVQRPVKELKGFKRIPLEPGETKTVTMTLQGRDLAYWDEGELRWVVEAEDVEIMIGSSAAEADVKVRAIISAQP